MKWCTITSLWILTIFGSTGLAVEEYVLTLDGQGVVFTQKDEGGRPFDVAQDRMKTRRGVAESEDGKVSYRAPLFSVNGQKVGVTPEVVVRVTGETSRKELESVCTKAGLRLNIVYEILYMIYDLLISAVPHFLT